MEDIFEFFDEDADTQTRDKTAQFNLDHQSQTGERWELIDPNSDAYQNGEIGDFVEQRMANGKQYVITVHRRPQCPTCQYALNREEDPLFLWSCETCGEYICPMCSNRCEACGVPMCPDHVDGQPVEDKTLCSTHRQDMQEQIQYERRQQELEAEHSREMDRRQQRRADLEKKKALLESIHRIKKEKRKLEQEENQSGFKPFVESGKGY